MKPLTWFAGFSLFLLTTLGAAPQAAADADIPCQLFRLDNGLTLIVHEDHKAPIVAFNVWYHVGSKNEAPGKTGFAHLFEHLMFNGSEHYDDDYFKPLQKAGATDLNGTTNEDRTNYFENVPVSALDLVLWMESDRMGHLKGAISQAKLDEQRGVVQNELRQGANEPYSVAEELIAKACYPSGHPYSWTVIGSLEDLQAARLEDVQNWFATYYGPNNAVVVVAGDIDARTALEKVKKYFGDIPPGPPVARHSAWVAKRTGEQRQTVQDRVPQARLIKVWNVPQWGTPDSQYLTLLAAVLSDGKNSRLFKRLVYDEQVATEVRAFNQALEIGGQFIIQADARPGTDLARLERAVDEELQKLLRGGPTPLELQRAKTQYRARFLRGVERIGGFGGKSDQLARSMTFAGRPDFYMENNRLLAEATAAAVQKAGQAWLSDGVYVLQILPYPALKADASGADRTRLPEVGAAPAAQFPELRRATLSNGLRVVLAERHAVPLVRLSLVVDAGMAADQFARPGTAALAMDMMDEGTAARSALQINDELALLGAQLGTGNQLDVSLVSLSALKEKLDPSLDLFADVILNPSFPEADFARLQRLQLARIQQEKSAPMTMALRVFPRLVYPAGHAYANPMTGSGFEADVASIRRADLVAFHRTWFRPDHATLVVVGDATLEEIVPRLEKRFASWRPGDVPAKNVGEVMLAARPAVYIMDKPGAPQSIVLAGHAAPGSADPQRVAIDMMNLILGGDFVSRINLNIRENKRWSYGARSMLSPARGQRPFIVYAPVQGDKTAETMVEIRKELDGMLGARPVGADEFANARGGQVLQLAGRWETAQAVERSLVELVQFNLADDFFRTYPSALAGLTLDDVGRAAARVLHPEALVWVVVGDRARIEPRIRELDYGEIRVVDGDGHVVQ